MSYWNSNSYNNQSYNNVKRIKKISKKTFQPNDIFLKPVDWNKIKLEPFEKNFYFEHPSIKSRTNEENKRILAELELNVLNNPPRPSISFETSCLPKFIISKFKQAGFSKPTPIQSQSWPVVLSGRDLIGIAETGSGKTLAFLIPAIIHINAQSELLPGDGPIVLIVAPTRELALQIEGEIKKFVKGTEIRMSCAYGGVNRIDQQNKLNKGVDIVVATPGRLLDFLESKSTNLKRTTYLVLDEADRMLDMGFEKPIKTIISQIRPDRQTLLFSATWPKEIQKLAAEFLINPVQVNVGSLEITSCKNVNQNFELVDQYNKMPFLLNFLRNRDKNFKALIFVATKISSNQMAKNLQMNGFNCASINGDKTQASREKILSDFRKGHVNILVGTDVASRGIDIKDITVVVNFDYPNTIEDYVHRVGRTGRAFATGESYTLLTKKDAPKMKGLITLLKNDKKEVPYEIQNLFNKFGGSKTLKNNRYRYENQMMYGRQRQHGQRRAERWAERSC